MSTEKYQFQAEVGKILNIVANSLYSDKEIFIREYISNASDACDKLRYEQIKNAALLKKSSSSFKISVHINKKEGVLSFIDNGIGMTKSELIKSLGTIAKSGTEEFLKKLDAEKNQDIEQIGKFGVGFYSGFMVTDKIIVKSKKAGEEESWMWISDGKGDFQIDNTVLDNNGTVVNLYINKDSKDFLEKVRVESVIKKYSDHITHPVFITEDGKKEEKKEGQKKINDGSALWTREKKDIKKEDYDNFYNQMGLNYDKPWKIIHNKIEGTLSYTNLLFIPSEKPFDLLNSERNSNLKLYVKKVFITDKCENILPKYLRFITGIVDSEDISLNISREMLQNDPIINKIKLNLVKKIIAELKKEISKNKDNYIKFWDKFGAVLKEGIHEDFSNKDSLLDISLFQSSKENKWCSVAEYVDRMKEGQEEIYYISGENRQLLMKSPQMETFLDKDLEVLFFTDPVDEFWLPNINEYKNKKFKSITKGDIDLKKFQKTKPTDENKNSESIKSLIIFLKSHYGDKVKDVKVSDRLKSSPVCFVADDNDMDMHLESILKKHKHLDKVSSKVLEINPDHSIIKGLSKVDITDSNKKSTLKEVSDILLDQAKLLEGIPLEDSKLFCDNINELLIKKFD